jgi:hypothetical protein
MVVPNPFVQCVGQLSCGYFPQHDHAEAFRPFQGQHAISSVFLLAKLKARGVDPEERFDTQPGTVQDQPLGTDTGRIVQIHPFDLGAQGEQRRC